MTRRATPVSLAEMESSFPGASCAWDRDCSDWCGSRPVAFVRSDQMALDEEGAYIRPAPVSLPTRIVLTAFVDMSATKWAEWNPRRDRWFVNPKHGE